MAHNPAAKTRSPTSPRPNRAQPPGFSQPPNGGVTSNHGVIDGRSGDTGDPRPASASSRRGTRGQENHRGRRHHQNGAGAGSGQAASTMRARLRRFLFRRSSIVGLLACLFLVAGLANLQWAEMELRDVGPGQSGDRSNSAAGDGGRGSDPFLTVGYNSFRLKPEEVEGYEDDDGDDFVLEKHGNDRGGGGSVAADRTGGGSNQTAAGDDDAESYAAIGDGNKEEGRQDRVNGDGGVDGGQKGHGLFGWRTFWWGAGSGQDDRARSDLTGLSQEEVISPNVSGAAAAAINTAVAAARGTALLVALEDGPAGVFALEAWSDFARSALQERKAAATALAAGTLPPRQQQQGSPSNVGEGRKGGGGEVRKRWGWGWIGGTAGGTGKQEEVDVDKGKEEGAVPGYGPGPEPRALLFPSVWVLTSDTAVDKAIRVSMPHLSSFFVPGAFGGADSGLDGGGRGYGGGDSGDSGGEHISSSSGDHATGSGNGNSGGGGGDREDPVAAKAAMVTQREVATVGEKAEWIWEAGGGEGQAGAGAGAGAGAHGRRRALVKAHDSPETVKAGGGGERGDSGGGERRGEGGDEAEAAEARRRTAKTRRATFAGGGGGGSPDGRAAAAPQVTSWSDVLELFLSMNPEVRVFGFYGEGTLPTDALLPRPLPSPPSSPSAATAYGGDEAGDAPRLDAGPDGSKGRDGGDGDGGVTGHALESLLWPLLSNSVPPTAIVSRARGWWRCEDMDQEEDVEWGSVRGGVCESNGGVPGTIKGRVGEWMSDKFVAQVWCNRAMLATARRRGTDLGLSSPAAGGDGGGRKSGLGQASFLHVIQRLVRAPEEAGAVLVDGTRAVPSRFYCSGGGGGGGGTDDRCLRRTRELERGSSPESDVDGSSSAGAGGGGGGGDNDDGSRGGEEADARRRLQFGWWAKQNKGNEVGVGTGAEAGGVQEGGGGDAGLVSVRQAVRLRGNLGEGPGDANVPQGRPLVVLDGNVSGAAQEWEEMEEKEEAVEKKEVRVEHHFLELLAKNAFERLEQERRRGQQGRQRVERPPPLGNHPKRTGAVAAPGAAPPLLPEADFYIGTLGLALDFGIDANGGGEGHEESVEYGDAGGGGGNRGAGVRAGAGSGVAANAVGAVGVGRIITAPWPPDYLLDHVALQRSPLSTHWAPSPPGSGRPVSGGGGGGGGGRRLVVVTSVNCGYLDMAVNFLLSVRRAGVGSVNVLFVAMDEIAFDFLDALAPGCAVLFPEGSSGRRRAVKAGEWGDEIFKHEAIVRPDILLAIMGQGYKVLWSDVDVVWLGNPLPLIPDTTNNATAAEVMLQIDGKPINKCTCFMYLDSTPKAKTLLKLWREELMKTGVSQNQKAFQRPLVYMEETGLRLDLLPDEVMPPGFKIFDEEFVEQNYESLQNKLLMVHNNWIIGHSSKEERFRKSGLWEVGDWEFPSCQRRRNRRLWMGHGEINMRE